MASQLAREIGNLKKSILTLSALVEDNLRRALSAVETRDEALATEAVERDFPIDLMEVDVEEDCLKALALYQPVAGDLRFIVTTIKINTTLERVGDLAVNIAERARLLATMEEPVVRFDLGGMATKAQRMVSNALDSLVRSDATLARAVLFADDEIDDLDRELTATLHAAARERPEWLEPVMQLLQVSRFIERVADHATSIAEDVIYMTEGEIPRHSVKRAVAEAMGINGVSAAQAPLTPEE
jgi:phosphate transport system protein